MAGPCACPSPCWNFPSAGKDELAGAASRVLTNDSRTPTHTFAISSTPILVVAIGLAVAPPLDNKLFKQFIKAYLETQMPGWIVPKIDLKPCKQLFKARFPDLYYSNLHMDCYQFYQQCKDYFKTVGAKGSNRIPFAASFLYRLITQQWLQFKRQYNGAMPMSWPEFKDFLQKKFGDFKAFIDSIWKKVKRNSQY